jgi:phage baseplate assembly protein W
MAIQTTRTPARYKDFYNNFDVHPARGDLFVLEDADSVKNSIKNLIFTNRGERFFQPLIGSSINRTLFENISPETTFRIKTYIETTIENFEPRAKLIATYVVPSEDENAYNVTIVFSLVNNPNPISFDLLLTRVR